MFQNIIALLALLFSVGAFAANFIPERKLTEDHRRYIYYATIAVIAFVFCVGFPVMIYYHVK